jgi:hypothetical protein
MVVVYLVVSSHTGGNARKHCFELLSSEMLKFADPEISELSSSKTDEATEYKSAHSKHPMLFLRGSEER